MKRVRWSVYIAGAAVGLAALTACGADTSSDGSAGDWPGNKPIRYIVPYSPGGAVDVSSRLIVDCLADEVGGRWVVDNLTGAAGVEAMNKIINATPDGHTFGTVSHSMAVATPLLVAKDAGYTYEDFGWIGQIALYPSLLLVQSDSPYKTMEDLIDAAKAKPGSISVATSGAQSSFHLALGQIADEYGVKLTGVPFPGDADAIAALLGGQVDARFSGLNPDALKYIESGDFRPLATGATGAVPDVIKDVPTLESLGFTDLISTDTTFAVAGPKGLSDEVTKKLTAATEKCVGSDEYKNVMKFQAKFGDSDEVLAFMKKYDANLQRLVK